MKNNLITTHVNGYFAGNYSSIEVVPANKTVCEVFYDGTFHTAFYNGTEWIEKATEQEIAEANKPKVPIQVKNMKFRLALIKSGIMPSSIDSVITQMPEGAMKENIFTLWNFADYLERNDASLNYMAGQFNITHEQLDEIFINGNLL